VPDQRDHDTLSGDPTSPFLPTFTGEFPAAPGSVALEEPPSEPLPIPAQPIVVPGAYQYLKRWRFVLVVAGVWLAAAAAGLGLYYWWFHSLDKTPSAFVVLLFLVVCTVGSLIAAMAQDKPMVSGLSVALMSAPLAAVGAAAVLHGMYFCDVVGRCLLGVVPY
jgi:hypothetical protein